MTIAIYPGSFDPVTLGHLDIIRRASKRFDKLIVCVMVNSSKHPWFTIEERKEMLAAVTKDFQNVEVDSFDGLLVDYMAQNDISVIVRGARNIEDFEAENVMARANKSIAGFAETILLFSDPRYTFLSSSFVKNVGKYGVDLQQYIPPQVIPKMQQKLRDISAAV